jgi:hypothetical protein
MDRQSKQKTGEGATFFYSKELEDAAEGKSRRRRLGKGYFSNLVLLLVLGMVRTLFCGG